MTSVLQATTDDLWRDIMSLGSSKRFRRQDYSSGGGSSSSPGGPNYEGPAGPGGAAPGTPQGAAPPSVPPSLASGEKSGGPGGCSTLFMLNNYFR